MQPNTPLIRLLNTVNTFKISGFLSFPYRADNDENEDAANRLLHNVIEITDKKIDDITEFEFRTKLEHLKKQTVTHLRNQINLDTPISKAINSYKEAIESINYTLEDLERNRPEPSIIFSNEETERETDPKYIRQIEFEEYKKEYDFLSTIILDRLKSKLKTEIEYLERSSTIKEFITSEKLETLEREPIQVLERKEPKYLIAKATISSLYTFCCELVFDGITEDDFIKCFDINNTPSIHPHYINRHQIIMVHALTCIQEKEITKIDQGLILINFGIKNYDQLKSSAKSRPVPKKRRILQDKISEILSFR